MVKVRVQPNEHPDSASPNAGDPDVTVWVDDGSRSWSIEFFDTHAVPITDPKRWPTPARGWLITEREPFEANWIPGKGAKRGHLNVTAWRPLDEIWAVPATEGWDVLHEVLVGAMGRLRAGRAMDAMIGLEEPVGTTS